MLTLNRSKIVEGFNSKEGSAVTWVYNRYYPDVVRIVEKLVGFSTDNEDLVGEVFLKVVATKTSLKSIKKIRDFIYMTSKTISLNYIRDQELKRSSDMTNFYQNLNDHDRELADVHTTFDYLINEKASRLPDKYRRVITMVYFYSMPVEEIAEELGISEKTVVNIKSDALRKLKLFRKEDGKNLFQLFFFL